jgi:hypothetical protein
LLFVANGNGNMKGGGQIDEVKRGRRGGIGEITSGQRRWEGRGS